VVLTSQMKSSVVFCFWWRGHYDIVYWTRRYSGHIESLIIEAVPVEWNWEIIIVLLFILHFPYLKAAKIKTKPTQHSVKECWNWCAADFLFAAQNIAVTGLRRSRSFCNVTNAVVEALMRNNLWCSAAMLRKVRQTVWATENNFKRRAYLILERILGKLRSTQKYTIVWWENMWSYRRL